MSLEKQEIKKVHVKENFPCSNRSTESKEKAEIEKEKHAFIEKPKEEVQIMKPHYKIPLVDGHHESSVLSTKSVKSRSDERQSQLKELIINAIAEGKYKQKIVFFDIWDFAGQREFYMTHQLFLTSRGIFVLMFNACHSLRLDHDSTIAGHQEPSAAGKYYIL